ncbi:acyltransferase family protein [Mucilaginibacter gilvus]|uniref:Acyltransferase n=1 Tax=Mucilaginibacter gilvus TaxID=2305909 RepID=A0A3S3V108_9SPHI|nr:acyltransferase [Mucilaginibacter gilvus]RWY55499.1 acyltransferase [Mucilaginibacter gilvus]
MPLKALKQFIAKLFADITTIPKSLQQSHFPELDGLRGLAILLLLMVHFGFNYYLRHYGVSISSTTSAHIFFVLSGFLITTLLLKEKLRNGRISLKYFYIRRALRILPVAWLFLIVLIGLNRFLYLHIPVADFIASLLFFKNFPMRNEPYTAHFWSLAVEEQFYFSFPILLAINTRWYTILSLSIVILVPLACIIGGLQLDWLSNNPVLHFIIRCCRYAFWKGPIIILIGSLFSILIFKGIIKPEKIKAHYLLSTILVIVAIVIHRQTSLFYTKYVSEYLSALLVGIAMVISISHKDFLSKLLSTAFLTTMGVLSYSIYIWQELFIGVKAFQPWMQYFTLLPMWGVILVKLAFLAIIVSFSFIFEVEFLKLKDKFHYAREGASKKAAPKS